MNSAHLVDLSHAVKINDMFVSLQGESKFTGHLCTFIRFQGCGSRCTICDTPQAQSLSGGEEKTVKQIISFIKAENIPLIEFTGGEPLLQIEGLLSCVFYLLRDTDHTILIETSGNACIKPLIGPNPKLHIIMDIKMPSTGEHKNLCEENLSLLNPWDEVKMVCSCFEDFMYAKDMINKYTLPNPTIHTAWGHNSQELASLILKERVPVRFGIQLHKLLKLA